jgi:hypothetical protein
VVRRFQRLAAHGAPGLRRREDLLPQERRARRTPRP